MIENFDNYQFRCSALGKIVSKSGKLTDGVKSYLLECFIGEIYGIRKNVSSKYFEKGLFEEESGITLLNRTIYPTDLLLKNKDRLSNEFIHGECDIMTPDKIVYDIKNAWDLFTFAKSNLSWDYEWQLRGYIWLFGAEKGRLFYCLNNTPEHLLVELERSHFYKGGFLSMEDDNYLEECEEIRKKHFYDQMKDQERFKVWDVLFTEENEKTLKNAVKQARDYMNILMEEHDNRIINNYKLMKK